MKRVVISILGAMLAGVAPAAAQTESPYIRVVEPDGDTIRLDVAVRTLIPADEARPVVHLVGAVHIADESFYRDMQSFLDVHDVVLYEGVGGGHESVAEPEAIAAKNALITERRVLFLQALADDVARRRGSYPATTHELVESFEGSMADAAERFARDGWGNEIAVENDGFDLVSFGADGAVGGEGMAADIRASELRARPTGIVPDPRAEGLQRDLSEALGLVFQLDGIDYTHPHWRNSDMNFGEIREALGGAPAGDGEVVEGGEGDRSPLPADAPDELKAAEALFSTLSGDSFLAKASAFLLKMVGASPSGRAMVKIMLADTLTQAEELLGAQPAGLADLMTVIIDERNRAVVRDLHAIVRDEPGVGSVAIFYGAGHFGDLESRIADELGYSHEATLWIPAMTIDLREAGLNPAQVQFMRRMMRDMIQAQLEVMGDR